MYVESGIDRDIIGKVKINIKRKITTATKEEWKERARTNKENENKIKNNIKIKNESSAR